MLTAANTYTGGTTLSGGTLSIASDANLGAAAGGLTLNGGTLLTTADLTSARAVTLGAAGGTIDNGGHTAIVRGRLQRGRGAHHDGDRHADADRRQQLQRRDDDRRGHAAVGEWRDDGQPRR